MGAGGKSRVKMRTEMANKAPATLRLEVKWAEGRAFAFMTDSYVGGCLERLNDGTDPFSGAMPP